MNFGERLQAARKRRGWSQWDLAGKMDLTQRTVSRWETGETLPAMSIMEALAANVDEWGRALRRLDPRLNGLPPHRVEEIRGQVLEDISSFVRSLG